MTPNANIQRIAPLSVGSRSAGFAVSFASSDKNTFSFRSFSYEKGCDNLFFRKSLNTGNFVHSINGAATSAPVFEPSTNPYIRIRPVVGLWHTDAFDLNFIYTAIVVDFLEFWPMDRGLSTREPGRLSFENNTLSLNISRYAFATYSYWPNRFFNFDIRRKGYGTTLSRILGYPISGGTVVTNRRATVGGTELRPFLFLQSFDGPVSFEPSTNPHIRTRPAVGPWHTDAPDRNFFYTAKAVGFLKSWPMDRGLSTREPGRLFFCHIQPETNRSSLARYSYGPGHLLTNCCDLPDGMAATAVPVFKLNYACCQCIAAGNKVFVRAAETVAPGPFMKNLSPNHYHTGAPCAEIRRAVSSTSTLTLYSHV